MNSSSTSNQQTEDGDSEKSDKGTTEGSTLRRSTGVSGVNLRETNPTTYEGQRRIMSQGLPNNTATQLEQLRQLHALSALLRSAPHTQQQPDVLPSAVGITRQVFPTTIQIHPQLPLDPLDLWSLSQGSQLPSLRPTALESPSQLELALLLQQLTRVSQPSRIPSAQSQLLSLLGTGTPSFATTPLQLVPTFREAAAAGPLPGIFAPNFTIPSVPCTTRQQPQQLVQPPPTIASLLQASRTQISSLGTDTTQAGGTTTTGVAKSLPKNHLVVGNASQATTTAVTAATQQRRRPVTFPDPTPRKRRRYNHESFPQKLHRLLTESHTNGTQHIARFVQDGSQFEIGNVKLWEQQIMPQYFRTKNANSVKRLMRMYGFRKTQGRWMEGTFQHDLFHRDYPEMAGTIQRIEQQDRQKKNYAQAEEEGEEEP